MRGILRGEPFVLVELVWHAVMKNMHHLYLTHNPYITFHYCHYLLLHISLSLHLCRIHIKTMESNSVQNTISAMDMFKSNPFAHFPRCGGLRHRLLPVQSSVQIAPLVPDMNDREIVSDASLSQVDQLNLTSVHAKRKHDDGESSSQKEEELLVKKKSKTESALDNILECPVCTVLMIDKIYQCKNGHLICGDCRDKLTKRKCHSCQLVDLTARNLSLEHLSEVSYSTLKCSNYEYGCKCEIPRDCFSKHVSTCMYKQYRCPANFHIVGCSETKTFSKKDLLIHMHEKHKSMITTAVSTNSANNYSASQLNYLKCDPITAAGPRACYYVDVDGDLIGLIRLFRDEKLVWFCQNFTNASFMYHIEIVYCEGNDVAQWSYTGISKIYDNCDKQFYAGRCASLPAGEQVKLLNKINSNLAHNYKLSLKLKIQA